MLIFDAEMERMDKYPLLLLLWLVSLTGIGQTLSLAFTGDVLLDRGVRRVVEAHGMDYLFTAGIDSVFAASQVVVANLECPATKVKAPVQKLYIFRGEPEWLNALRRHGITHLNLANNHAIDQGRKGLMDARNNIATAGMVAVGAGATMAEAAQPVLLASRPRNVWLVPSLRLALENFAYLTDRPCVSQEPMDTLLSRVRRLKAADSRCVVIVSLHWGAEHTLQPVPSQRLEAHRLIDVGADVIVGHHSHTLQTVEQYRGRDIYYGIGNFIFDQQKPINTKACIVRVDVTPNDVKTTALPVNINYCVPHLLISEK
ncbi:MAG: CapA family protein [Prevotella sp.]|nr:CapA family protein [Prevotella sp.]